MKNSVSILVLLLLWLPGGCSNTSLVDSEWLLKPGGAPNSYAVELEEGNMICVVEKDDPSNKSCVPRVHNEDGES